MLIKQEGRRYNLLLGDLLNEYFFFFLQIKVRNMIHAKLELFKTKYRQSVHQFISRPMHSEKDTSLTNMQVETRHKDISTR